MTPFLVAILCLLCGGCWACPPIQVGLVQVATDVWVRPAPVVASDGWTEPTLVWVNERTVWIADPGPHRCAGQALRREVMRRWPGRGHRLINTHAHPHNVLANSAWPDATPIHALPGVRQQMIKRCAVCLRNLRESLGEDWMRGTRWVLPNRVLRPGQWLPLGQGRWQVRAHEPAHTESDLSLWNAREARWFAASLVAWQGLPDLTRADLKGWLQAMKPPDSPLALDWVGAGQSSQAQFQWGVTRDYLQALQTQVSGALERGESMHDWLTWNEPVPLSMRTPEHIHRHQLNVQKVWHQLEDASFDRPVR